MSSTRFEQPELPLAEVSLAEHTRLTGHTPVAYTGKSGDKEWICTEANAAGKNCFASWPPPTRYEMQLENAILGLLGTGKTEIEIPGVGMIELGYN